MSTRTEFCPRCKKMVQVRREPLENSTHLFLSIISLGVWLFVWLGLWWASPKTCAVCGERTAASEPDPDADPE